MADFRTAFKITLSHEVGYVNDPLDTGGETYNGISRRWNPHWLGWAVIDKAKDKEFWPAMKEDDKILLSIYVENFYRDHYWDKLLCDEITDQPIANELFDNAVNMGIGTAVKFLQEGLNFLSKGTDLIVDGGMGDNTLTALSVCLKNKDELVLLKIMNILQGYRYLSIMRKSESQEKFARGWLKRVSIGRS